MWKALVLSVVIAARNTADVKPASDTFIHFERHLMNIRRKIWQFIRSARSGDEILSRLAGGHAVRHRAVAAITILNDGSHQREDKIVGIPLEMGLRHLIHFAKESPALIRWITLSGQHDAHVK